MILVLIPMRQFLEWELETESKWKTEWSEQEKSPGDSQFTKSRWGQLSESERRNLDGI